MTHDGINLPAIMPAARCRASAIPARYARNELSVRARHARGHARRSATKRAT